MAGVKRLKNVTSEERSDEDSKRKDIVWYLNSIKDGEEDSDTKLQQNMRGNDADGDVTRNSGNNIAAEPDLPNNITICNEKFRPRGLAQRRSSSALCLSNRDREVIEPVQHQAISRLQSSGYGSDGRIHQQLSRHSSLSNGQVRSPGSRLKTSFRRQINRPYDDDVPSYGSANKVSFIDPSEKPEDNAFDDDVFLESGTEAENLTSNCYTNGYGCPTFRGELWDNFALILSGLYGMLLVVIGIVFPMAEIFVHPAATYVFDLFYIYLFVVSMLFLTYVYVFLLHHGSLGIQRLASTLSLHGSVKKSSTVSNPLDICSISSLNTIGTGPRLRRRRITFKDTFNTGSFYLRLGAVGFGIGSMILDGLYVGQYFDSVNKSTGCNDAMQAIKPISKLLFTFTQTYFIFLNAKMRIFKYRSLARFGLMHMSATNICVWIRVIVVETLHNMHEAEHLHNHTNNLDTVGSIGTTALGNSSNQRLYGGNTSGEHAVIKKQVDTLGILQLPELSCQMSDLLGKVLVTASPVLYPFCIEYSLICAAILYVMWQNVGTKEDKNESEYIDEIDDDHKRSHRMSVDCGGSSRGLFLGIMLLVSSIVFTITIYVMMDKSDDKRLNGVLIANIGEILIYMLAIISVLAAAIRMRNLKFSPVFSDPLEENLILISMTGIYMFTIFSLIPGFYYHYTIEGFLTIITDIVMIVQATLQTIFIFAALRLSAAKSYHVRKKPGREFVTFLLLCNFALWGINTFATQLPSHNPAQVKFYGPKAWAIFTHISVPLGIFYRFHSTVCFSHVWKHAWKRKKLRE